MAHTNSTTNYALPQFLSTDKPAWLTDVNPAYSAIDTGIHNAQVAADNAQADATQALDDAAAAAGAATTADGKGSGAVASLSENFDPTATYSVGEYVMYNNLLYICTSAVTTPGPWTGATNWSRTTLDAIATSLTNTIDNLDIEDLNNVTITTSDNNKFLGIDVAGGNITASAKYAHNYSTSETIVGTWIDGKPIYQKTVPIGALPNNTTTGFEVVGEAIESLVDISVIATDNTGNYFIVLPNVSPNSAFQISYDVEIDNGKTKVFIGTARDVSSYYGVVTIRYTKR